MLFKFEVRYIVRRRRKHILYQIIFAVSVSASFYLTTIPQSLGAIDAKLLRHPDVSQTHIVFSYAEDLWIVSKSGGEAVRLTATPGEEQHPKFSPDGQFVAYTAPYADGNEDLYILPISGGVPKRITHHPAFDRLIDWRPDGHALLYATDMTSERARYNQIYTVDIIGGLPERLPMPYGEMATFSPDGNKIVYSFLKDFQNQPDFNREAWKRYRGGRAPDLWYFDFAANASRRLTDNDAPDSAPMWNKHGFYFSSERGGERTNIWSLNMETGSFEQITRFEDDDVTRPSIGPSDIVFELAGSLHLLTLETGEVERVEIETVVDHLALAPHRRNVNQDIQSAQLANNGSKAAFSARGDLFTIATDSGIVKNHGAGSVSAERYAALSPDGQNLAYMSDASGEYQLHIRDLNSGGVRTVTNLDSGFRYKPFWSPDGKSISFVDSEQQLFLVDVKSGRASAIDKLSWRDHFGLESFSVSWSPDSQWLAWSRGLENRNAAIFVYNQQTKTRTQLTSGYYSDENPVFDASGNYLFMKSMRSLSPVYSDIDFTWAYANSSNIAVAPLRRGVRSPLDASAELQPRRRSVEINLDDFESRIELLPVRAGNFDSLFGGDQRAIFLRQPDSGDQVGAAKVAYFDLAENSERTVVDHVDGLLDASGDNILVKISDAYHVVDIAADQSAGEPLPTDDFAMIYDRREENQQILKDAWRFERDFFYDPGLHSVDWDEALQKYLSLFPHAVTASDLSFVLREFVGELSAGHIWAVATPRERYAFNKTGLLGVDFALENGAYRIAKIYDAGPRRHEYRSPLAAPGVNIGEGAYLLAVNGAPLSIKKDPWAAFEGLAGKRVELTFNDRPAMNGARTVVVTTLDSEQKLRELAWVEENRRKVDAATNGAVGYIYVPDTARNGQDELMRQYRAQFKKKGLIIDERFNSGGALGDRLVELLNRPPLVYFSVRSGPDYPLPELSHYGPKALLTNGWSYSGGDGFPLLFQAAGVGPVIGERTWGGLIGPAMSIPFVSGGRIAAPPQRVYTTTGEWAGPNGVVPDILIENDPGLLMKGRDLQLERAIEYVLDQIDSYPTHRKPAYPSELRQKR